MVLIGGLLVWRPDRSSGPSGTATPSAGSARSDPLVAMLDRNGALATVDSTGRTAVLGGGPGTTFGFPAWSPDGSRVAVVVSGADDTSISIFPVARPDLRPSGGVAPVVVYRSARIPPFYLYWSPDGRRVSFLATEANGISLRVAPADGSAPLDGGPGTVIRQGAPLYFDWVATDRLLLHVGTGPGAFLGEVGLDGASVIPALDGSGDFRPAVVGASGQFMAFVRGAAPSAVLVVAARDGSAEQTVPVSGPAAIVFDPGGTTVAWVAADQPGFASLAFPIGPLRLLDPASGARRTLLDGAVVGFFWSPDGRTIAAIRLQAGSGTTVADRSIVAAAAIATPTPIPSADRTSTPSQDAPPTPGASLGSELHLLFVNVADGTIRSDRVIRLSPHFVNEFLPYFDQYALSHRVWAPDSSSLLLPLADETGRVQLAALQPDGSPSTLRFDGDVGFWSP